MKLEGSEAKEERKSRLVRAFRRARERFEIYERGQRSGWGQQGGSRLSTEPCRKQRKEKD
jgi:hypothetical protein